MPTTQGEKPAKARARSRKADRSNSKKVTVEAVTVSLMAAVEARAEPDPDPVSPMAAEAEMAPVDITPAVPMETVQEVALSGEVLPPEVPQAASDVAPLQAIAQAYGEYTRKSWLNGRFLVERLIAVRSFDEAIEIQGEFAKQAYTNFLAQSERICALYGGWALGFFRPFEKLATEWRRH